MRRPTHLLAIALAAPLLAATSGPAATGVTPAAVACGDSPTGNGTGYVPPSNPTSLPQGSPAPGPAILHQPLRSAPMLENTGPWTAEPIMVSGTRAYRDGEFLYQDFLYDDRGLTYPDEPDRYAGNAADIVEVRLQLLDDALAVRVTFNTMLDVDAVAATIVLGESATPYDLPHDAGAVAVGELFVTVHGCEGDIVDAATGLTSPIAPVVSTDLERRQVDVRIPYTAFDPRGDAELRVGAAAGLWDVDGGTYLRPDDTRPAFFNVAFREYGPWVQNTWMVGSQTAALDAADLSTLAATIDVATLQAGTDDDLLDQPGGVPTTGPMNRILVSSFEPTQGRGNSFGGDITGDFRCVQPDCTPMFSGRLQPYSVYVPATPAPADGYGLVVNLHGANSNHNHFEGGGPPEPLDVWRMFTEGAGHPSIFLLPNGRGPTYFYHDLSGADVFEAWAHVAANYDIDPSWVVQTGSSMGGYGAYKLATQFPDLYVAVFPNIAINLAGVAVEQNSDGVDETDTRPMYPSLRNVPVLATSGTTDPLVNQAITTANAVELTRLGYRVDAWWFVSDDPNGHAEYRDHVPDEYAALTTSYGPLDPDPRRVTYVLNAVMHQPEVGLTADKAYWLSGLTLADESLVRGQIDVVSRGFPTGDPAVLLPVTDAGPAHEGSGPYERLMQAWGDAPTSEVADVLEITATNVATVTIDVDRARVSCDATVVTDADVDLAVTLVGADCPGGVDPASTTGGDDPQDDLAATGGGAALLASLTLALAATTGRRRRTRPTTGA